MHQLDHVATLADDYAYCENIIKEKSKSFYFAFSRLPKEKAQAIYGVYAFCRLADDSIDENDSPSAQKEALSQIKAELALFEKRQEPDTPMWRVLRDVFNRYEMSIEPFYDQLKGQALDYNFKRPKTLTDLEEYSYYVAGTVGLMVLPIIAVKNHRQLKQVAVSLGVAMQLTNILRDVGEDLLTIDRIYLPSDLCLEEGYTTKALKEQVIDHSFITVWEKLAQRAEIRYTEFKQSLVLFDEDSQFPVLLAANVYRGILEAVRKSDYDCFSKKNATSLMDKMCLYRYSLGTLRRVRKGSRN